MMNNHLNQSAIPPPSPSPSAGHRHQSVECRRSTLPESVEGRRSVHCRLSESAECRVSKPVCGCGCGCGCGCMCGGGGGGGGGGAGWVRVAQCCVSRVAQVYDVRRGWLLPAAAGADGCWAPGRCSTATRQRCMQCTAPARTQAVVITSLHQPPSIHAAGAGPGPGVCRCRR
jgi:hypothetical protein